MTIHRHSQAIGGSSPTRARTIAAVWLLVLSACIGFAHPAAAAEMFKSAPAGLVDQDGRPYTGIGEPGTLRLIFFGYTHCPDICPTTLSDVSLALQSLPADIRERVRPIFVTADPGRDDPATMKAFIASFDPQLSAVTGAKEAIDAYAWDNSIYIVRNDGNGSDSYTVDHTASLLLVAPDGTVLERLPFAVGSEKLAESIVRSAQ